MAEGKGVWEGYIKKGGCEWQDRTGEAGRGRYEGRKGGDSCSSGGGGVRSAMVAGSSAYMSGRIHR